MGEPLWRLEAQLEVIKAVCRFVSAENGEVNDDTHALNPNGWDYISCSIHLGFGEGEKRG